LLLGIVVFLLGLGLLFLGISVYRSRWRVPLDLHPEVRLLVAVFVVLGTLGALYGIVSTALYTGAGESGLTARTRSPDRS